MLIVHGALDRQVPPRHAGRLAETLVAAGNPDVTLRLAPGLSHLLVPDPDGRASEWASLPALSLAPEILELVGDWLAARLGVVTEAVSCPESD